MAAGLLGGSASVCINAALTQNMPERDAMVISRETEIMTLVLLIIRQTPCFIV